MIDEFSSKSKQRHTLRPYRWIRLERVSFVHYLYKIKNIKILVFIGLMLLGLFGIYFFNNQNKSIAINGTKYIDKTVIEKDIRDYINNKSYLLLSGEELNKYLLSKYSILQDAYVSKSLVFGLIVNVQEYQPMAIVTDKLGAKHIATTNGVLIRYGENITEPLYTLHYENDINTLYNQDFQSNDIVGASKMRLVEKALNFIKALNEIGITGIYGFDLFGNLSILTIDSKNIKVDLKEQYFSMEDQIKILQKILNTEDYKKNNLFDLRFNNLLVKKLS